VLDLGAQPFIISCALKAMGYEVAAVDVEPESYMSIAERCGVKVVKRDLERERLDIRGADCAVFTEVIDYPTIGIASETLVAFRLRVDVRQVVYCGVVELNRLEACLF
jgi:predicted RNA methylase